VRRAVLTDLDGTLLDAHTYDWAAAVPALEALASAGVPLVICTSKTRAEVEALRAAMAHRDPFVVENGGAIFVPDGYFDGGLAALLPAENAPARADGPRHDYDVIQLGVPYRTLVDALHDASRAAGVAVRGWADMELEEIARRCEMTLSAARLAVAREYDEPFVIAGEHVGGAARLQAELDVRGVRLTRGDRFFHVMGPHDKGAATRTVVGLFRRAWGAVRVLAIGDAANDVAMLREADEAIVVASPQAAMVAARVSGAKLTRAPGPAGWNDAVLDWLAT
jgi:mannosyl-3-phosphoglycerate phosphatase